MLNKSLRKVYQNLKFTQMTNKTRSTEDEIVQALRIQFFFYTDTMEQLFSKLPVKLMSINRLFTIIIGQKKSFTKSLSD